MGRKQRKYTISDETHEQLRKIAAERGVRPSNVIEELVRSAAETPEPSSSPAAADNYKMCAPELRHSLEQIITQNTEIAEALIKLIGLLQPDPVSPNKKH